MLGKRLFLNLCLCLVFTLPSPSYACVHGELADGFFPENDMWIPEDSDLIDVFSSGLDEGGIDEETFNRVIDEVEAVYAPIFEAQGAKLSVNRRWKSGTVNAFASRSGNTWKVDMFGGLARHPAVTADGFALVLCHELGHHIAGYPKYDGGTDWASTEGQSDYFATSKCFKAVYGEEDNTYIFGEPYEEAIELFCKLSHFTSENDQATCIRAAIGGQSLANLLADLRGAPAPSVDTPDLNQVSTHYEGHPAAQCRFDTYLAGAVCDLGFATDTGDDLDYTAGYCTKADGYFIATRPECWFSVDQAKGDFSSVENLLSGF